MLAVALVEEGARLREAGIDAPILLLSEPEPSSAADVVRWGLIPTVYSETFVEALSANGGTQEVHLKVDTGMHRVGVAPEEVDSLVEAIQARPKLGLVALWTHFAVADEDPDYTRHQISSFDQVAARHDTPISHLANTAGAILFPESRRSLCRIGLGTYGLHPCPQTVGEIDLRPAMRLVTHVAHVQRLRAGERPSYGRVRELTEDSYVVTAPVGYADGFTRALTQYGSALIGGRRYPLAGTVTMDQIVIDTGENRFDVGDEVVLLGTQGDDEITAGEWAEELGTISYEVISSIGPRVPRTYV
jgi:alanine racemase